jgi:predicted dehydrogenase
VKTLRVAIVGCGLIGEKRARALPAGALALACDTDAVRANALAKPAGAKVTTDWQAAVKDPAVDIVIAATTHDHLAGIVTAAAAAGKHVLVEKPAALRAAQLDAAIDAAQRNRVCVRVGFNHRYHRAFRAARELVDAGAVGELTHCRGRYGHGGRPGYEKEWRANPSIAGGGEAIDQGLHLIDLSRWFLGDFVEVNGFTETYFWNMPVEDNMFLLMRTAQRRVASLHASWTEWKNQFSFEVFGKTGKLEVTGLGGSYGVERLAYYKMLPELGPPETRIDEFPMGDDSWAAEYAAFLDDIRESRTPNPGLADAQAALRIVERLYAMGAS